VSARRLLIALSGAAVLAAAPGLALAAKAKTSTVTVRVFDNYYSPSKRTINEGTKVRWLWGRDVTDVHDVKLVSAPKGVRKFQSEPLAAGQSFSRKLTKPGTYKFICTFHEQEMRMEIKVKRVARKKK